MIEEHSNELVQYVHDLKEDLGEGLSNLSVPAEHIAESLRSIDVSLAMLVDILEHHMDCRMDRPRWIREMFARAWSVAEAQGAPAWQENVSDPLGD